MGQTLLDMAKAQFKTYDIIMGVARDDESQVKSAAYHLQQAVELMLKHCIEISGIGIVLVDCKGDTALQCSPCFIEMSKDRIEVTE